MVPSCASIRRRPLSGWPTCCRPPVRHGCARDLPARPVGALSRGTKRRMCCGPADDPSADRLVDLGDMCGATAGSELLPPTSATERLGGCAATSRVTRRAVRWQVLRGLCAQGGARRAPGRSRWPARGLPWRAAPLRGGGPRCRRPPGGGCRPRRPGGVSGGGGSGPASGAGLVGLRAKRVASRALDGGLTMARRDPGLRVRTRRQVDAVQVLSTGAATAGPPGVGTDVVTDPKRCAGDLLWLGGDRGLYARMTARTTSSRGRAALARPPGRPAGHPSADRLAGRVGRPAVENFSRGMKHGSPGQRAGRRPGLCCDEPTTGMDPVCPEVPAEVLALAGEAGRDAATHDCARRDCATVV